MSEPSESKIRSVYPVIGIGFSAGGLEAFKKLLTGISPNSKGAYVVVQHLLDGHDSQLPEIIGQSAPLPVIEITEGTEFESGRIYVLRRRADILIKSGVFHLSQPTNKENIPVSSIDRFFASLASDEAEMVVGMILSGTGSDGTVGMQKIKAAGGICLVQNPDEAEFADMPQSAIASGCIDYVGSAEKLADRADRYFSMRSGNHVTSRSLDSEKESLLIRMLCLIRARTGNDFRFYKRPSVLRRIERRMSLVDIPDFEDFLEYLRQNDREVRDVARDILISVTCFFRDPAVWQVLEAEIIPRIIGKKKDGEDIRVWVPGCATGEEAYSYGIIVSEAIERSGKSIGLQIYATDIDDQSREIARAASYPNAIIEDVGEAYAHKYFEPATPNRLSIQKSLREKVVFAKQNILSDPSFSRMDLVSCRNLLIYLNGNMQKRLINLLHFSLNEEGIAVLGSAESISQSDDLFKPLDRDLRIFERIGKQSPPPHDGSQLFSPSSGNPIGNVLPKSIRPRSRSIEETNRSSVMEHFDAASVLVDEKLQVRYLSGQTKRYFHHPEGAPSKDLSLLVNASVGHKIRTFAKQVLADREPQSFIASIPSATSRRTRITLKAIRLEDDSDGLFIIFEAAPEGAEPKTESSPTLKSGAGEGTHPEDLINEMTRELNETQSELRINVEDLASANEELKSSNEEIMSMNEELQSSNEELETSKEELQSVNDELSNVNKELSTKVIDLEKAHNDIHNLLTSSDIGTIFLDDQLCIQRFTKATCRLFNLIPSDIGRPIADLTAKFEGSNLIELCGKVLDDLRVREDEIKGIDDSFYLRRILPYRTQDNRIEGIVITFSDVSGLKRAQAELVEAERFLRLAIQNSQIIIFAQDRDLKYSYMLNQEIAFPETKILGKSDRDLFPDDYRNLESLKNRVLKTGESRREKICLRGDSDSELWLDLQVEPLTDHDGVVSGLIGAAIDITEQIHRESDLCAANEAKTRFLSSMSHDIRTPLTAILSLAEMLEEVLDSDHQEIGEEITNSCTHLIESLDSVLKLAHLQSGNFKLSNEPVHLNPILTSIGNTFDPARKQNETGRVHISLEVENSELFAIADIGSLRRVLSNLVGNAVKFCPDKPVIIRAYEKFGRIEIQVEDHGPGISEEFLKDLFKPFTQQAESRKTSLPGSGLGLSIVHELVQLMDGEIKVDSSPGRGTTMTVCLPAYSSDQNTKENKSGVSKGLSRSKTGSKAVICDDNETSCLIVSRMLRDYDATVVSDEKDLFPALDDADVLLLDINMNGENRGSDIMKSLRKDEKHKDLYIVAFTAHALPGQKEEFIKEGFDDYLSKPFRKAELIEKISHSRKS